jgi:formamidopyrimidine-DNA glycosylase
MECGRWRPVGHTRRVPEGLEVEMYRRAAERVVGRTVAAVVADERVTSPGLSAVLTGERVESVRRRGKLLLVGTSGPTVGIHFGMTGRLVVDDTAAIERLEYASARDDPAWDRFVVRFDGGGAMRVNDPRRWARFELEPDTSRLGPDMFDVSVDDLVRTFGGRRRAVKSVLLDQHLVAGLGNMCVDEVLWHARVAPGRSAGELSTPEIRAIHRVMATELPRMLERGGSHTGVLAPPVRSALPVCPADGAPLVREPVAGRSTVWCRFHQH